MSTDPQTGTLIAARANRVPWPPLLLASLVAAALLLEPAIPLAWPGLDNPMAHAIGLGFAVAGLALAIAGAAMLVSQKTTVMPHGCANRLVTSGPYRYWRNPIYLGETLIMLGVAEVTKNLWFVAAAGLFVVAVTALQIVPEERHLDARFGQAYRDYKSRTRRWI